MAGRYPGWTANAPALARATIGQSPLVGRLLVLLRDADWPAAKAQAAMVHGAGTLALAEYSDVSSSDAVASAKAAAKAVLDEFAQLSEAQRREFAQRLKQKLDAENPPGDLAPALLALVTNSDTGPLEKLYRDTRASTGMAKANASARIAALGMVSTGIRGYFWADLNLAGSKQTPPGTDPGIEADILAEELDTIRERLESSEVLIHTAAARGALSELEAACDQHIASAIRASTVLATMLGRTTRLVDDLYAAGRDNDRLRKLHRTAADGFHLARRAWAGILAAHLLNPPVWQSNSKHPVARLVGHARNAPAFTSLRQPTVVSTLPDPSVAHDQAIRVEGRVLKLEPSRIERGRKLVTTVSLSVGRSRPPLLIRADYHDLGHEGLTVGAYLSAVGASTDSAGNRMLQVRRRSLSDPLEVGWITAWYALARLWTELSPGALDLRWSPGRGAKVTEESEKLGVGVGDVLFNKPFPVKGEAYV